MYKNLPTLIAVLLPHSYDDADFCSLSLAAYVEVVARRSLIKQTVFINLQLISNDYVGHFSTFLRSTYCEVSFKTKNLEAFH